MILLYSIAAVEQQQRNLETLVQIQAHDFQRRCAKLETNPFQFVWKQKLLYEVRPQSKFS